jgi:predicted O-methyltransferase YrrM
MIETIRQTIPTGVTTAEAEVLERLARDAVVLEVGAWYGFSSVIMGRVAHRVLSVDWHHGDDHAGHAETMDAWLGNRRSYRLEDRVDLLQGRFEDVLPLLGRVFDGAFLDGMHDYASASRDLRLVSPLIRPGGWLAIHDYEVPAVWGFEVKRAVDEWLTDQPVRIVERVDKLVVAR